MTKPDNISPWDLNRIYDTLLNHLDEGVHMVDAKGTTVLYNDRMAEIESMHKKDVLFKQVQDVFHFPGDEHSTLLQAVRLGKATRNVKQTYFNLDGKKITTVNNTYPIEVDGKLVGAVEIARDITKMEKLLQDNIQKPTNLRYSFENIIGSSPAIQEVIENARRAARTSSSVLLIGETGTGKELFAQSIHQTSARTLKPFISQNCAALPDSLIEGLLFGTVKGAFTGAIDRPGLLEMADEGTLLLDELNSLSPALQAKLLRVLQEKTVLRVGATKDKLVDVRILATMNEDPLDAILLNHLRKDLYYRLGVVTLFIPPLRERKQDIPLLTQFFVEKYNRLFQMNVNKVSDEVMSYFESYNWPGNVRELEHVIEGAMNMLLDDSEIRFEYLPFPLRRRFDALSQTKPLLNHGRLEGISNALTPGEQKLSSIDDSLANPPRQSSQSPVVQSPAIQSGASHAVSRLHGQVHEYEKQLIQDVLDRYGGNISRAAKELGLSRQSLQYRLRKWQINKSTPPSVFKGLS